MNTTQISIDTELFNHAADYARSHNISVEKMMENLIFTFMMNHHQGMKLKRPKHYSPDLLKLVGIAKDANITPDDLNADAAKWEYLKQKYEL